MNVFCFCLDFINQIIQFDPTKRMSLSKMTEHAWFKGPTIDSESMISEMNSRKYNMNNLENLKEDRAAGEISPFISGIPRNKRAIERDYLSQMTSTFPSLSIQSDESCITSDLVQLNACAGAHMKRSRV